MKMFGRKYRADIPTDFASYNFGCKLSKYIIFLQNEDGLPSSDRTKRSKVNKRFQRAVELVSVTKLNNDKEINGKPLDIEKPLDDAITNNLNCDSRKFVEKETNNNNTKTDNESVKPSDTHSNLKGSSGDSTKSSVSDDQGIDNEAFENENVGDLELKTFGEDFEKEYESAFRRSLSFGDRPRRRETRTNNAGGDIKDENRFDSIEFYTGTEPSSSADSAFSGDSWRLSLEEFTSKRQGSKRKQRKVSKQMRSFYKSQDDLINQYEEIRLDVHDVMEAAETERKLRKKASNYAKATFAVNLVLLAIKIVAVVLSGSISLISSLVDSSVDLLSGVVIWVTSRAVKKTDRYIYPQGRTKLEPLSIVILAVIMSVASLQIIKESFTKIFGLVNNTQSPPIMDLATIGIASATVVIKLILFILCRRVNHPTVQALAQDHRNDVLSNFVAIVFGYLGSQEMQAHVDATGLIYIDPIGAILISIYIIVNWIITGWDQIKLLIGHTATAAFISKITWLCVDHHKKIEKVDTVRAFHFGHNFLVEVDIVLPPEMTVEEAHDIAEPLQQKIERLSNVERAFVHIDYEVTHNPKSEHKVV